MQKIRPLTFDPSGCFLDQHGITPLQLEQLAPRMVEIRDEVLKTDLTLYASGDIPPEKMPLDAAFLEMPER